MKRVAGEDRVVVLPLIMGSEDFAHYADLVPSVFFYVGVTPFGGRDVADALDRAITYAGHRR